MKRQLLVFATFLLVINFGNSMWANAADIQYSIASPELTKTSLMPNGNLDFTFSVSTNDPNPQPVYCYIDAFINPFEAALISGSKKAGIYNCQAKIPDKPFELFPSGKYPLNILIVYSDQYGKQELRKSFGNVIFSSTDSPSSSEQDVLAVCPSVKKGLKKIDDLIKQSQSYLAISKDPKINSAIKKTLTSLQERKSNWSSPNKSSCSISYTELNRSLAIYEKQLETMKRVLLKSKK